MTTPTARQAKEEFPIAKFDAWLAKQPEDRSFNYCSNCGCLFATFAQEALGLADALAYPGEIFESKYSEATNEKPMIIPKQIEAAACLSIYDQPTTTFTIAQFRKQLEAK